MGKSRATTARAGMELRHRITSPGFPCRLSVTANDNAAFRAAALQSALPVLAVRS